MVGSPAIKEIQWLINGLVKCNLMYNSFVWIKHVIIQYLCVHVRVESSLCDEPNMQSVKYIHVQLPGKYRLSNDTLYSIVSNFKSFLALYSI